MTVNDVETAVELPSTDPLLATSKANSVTVKLTEVTTILEVRPAVLELAVSSGVVRLVDDSICSTVMADVLQSTDDTNINRLCITYIRSTTAMPMLADVRYFHAARITSGGGVTYRSVIPNFVLEIILQVYLIFSHTISFFKLWTAAYPEMLLYINCLDSKENSAVLSLWS